MSEEYKEYLNQIAEDYAKKMIKEEEEHSIEQELVQMLIIQALQKHPEGLTDKEIARAVNKKIYHIKKIKKYQRKIEKTLDKIMG